eukprot:9341513-Alexandrium_andersonii.AAC.1
MDAVCLVASAHGSALWMLCDKPGAHYGDVGAAARQARRRKMATMSVQRKLSNLDLVCAFLRHATAQHNEALLCQFVKMLMEE